MVETNNSGAGALVITHTNWLLKGNFVADNIISAGSYLGPFHSMYCFRDNLSSKCTLNQYIWYHNVSSTRKWTWQNVGSFLETKNLGFS